MKKFNLYCGFKSTMYDSIRHRIWSVMRQFFSTLDWIYVKTIQIEIF